MDYKTARGMLCSVIGNEALRFHFLLESDRLSEGEKMQYSRLITMGRGGESDFIMSDEVFTDSLLILTRLLQKHYDQKIIQYPDGGNLEAGCRVMLAKIIGVQEFRL